MRVRTVLAIVIIVFLIAFFIVPIAGGKQGPATPGTGRVQRLPDAGQPYTPLFDEGISIVGDPALKADYRWTRKRPAASAAHLTPTAKVVCAKRRFRQPRKPLVQHEKNADQRNSA